MKLKSKSKKISSMWRGSSKKKKKKKKKKDNCVWRGNPKKKSDIDLGS